MWAIQSGDDVSSRLILPRWMSRILEMRICQFVHSYQRWEGILAKRAEMHRDLTPTQHQAYNVFLANKTQKLIFDKAKKQCVSDATTLKKHAKDCIAIKLHLSDEPAELQIEAADKTMFQLVWLKQQEPARSNAALPEVLNNPATVDDLPHQDEQEELDDAENAEDVEKGEDQPEMSEAAIRELDEQRAEAQNDNQLDDEDDEIEFLADSDEEISDFGVPPTAKKVKSFHTREAWNTLEARGLTDLPRHIRGTSIAYHARNRQWQGHYFRTRIPMCFSWGGTTRRTEAEALLRAIRAILESHLNVHPRDGMWRRQLDKVRTAEANL